MPLSHVLTEVQTVNVHDARTSVFALGATCGDVRLGVKICVTSVCGRSTARRHGMGVLRALEHNALVRAWHNGGQGLHLHIGFECNMFPHWSNGRSRAQMFFPHKGNGRSRAQWEKT